MGTQEKKHDGTVRICRKSKPAMYKPDRAHYCRVMQRCVLKMDHFCPWLNNCIGFYNHKFFVLFVAYMAMITVFMVFVMTPVFVNIVSNMEQITLDLKDQEFHVSLTYLMLCLLSVGLSAFFIFHAYLVLFNYTTIEFPGEARLPTPARPRQPLPPGSPRQRVLRLRQQSAHLVAAREMDRRGRRAELQAQPRSEDAMILGAPPKVIIVYSSHNAINCAAH